MSSMAGLNTAPGFPPSAASQPPSAGTGPRPQHHQRSKSSVLRTLMGGGHKRNNSDGATLPSAPLIAPIATTPAFYMSQQNLSPSRNSGVFHVGFDAAAAAAMEPQRYAHALGELQQNRQEQSPERRGRYPDSVDQQPPPSPSKTGFSTISLRAFGGGLDRSRDRSKPPKTRDNATNSPTKPKKAKSATNLAALLRPKSIKNLKQMLLDEGDAGKEKDKENQSPAPLAGSSEHRVPMGPPPPIYAQFASQLDSPAASWRAGAVPPSLGKKPRPKSFQAYMGRKESDRKGSAGSGSSDSHAKRPTAVWDKTSSAATGPATPGGSRGKSSSGGGGGPETATMPLIDPKDIDKHLEAMLDRRNIPENQRYKMRNLSDTIKMEFIRQDWAEMQAQLERPPSHDGHLPYHAATAAPAADSNQQDDTPSTATTTAGTASPTKKEKKKHGRGLSLTLVRGSGSGGTSAKPTPSSPTKKKSGDSSLGRHFRSKSTESLAGSEPPSPSPFSSSGLAALSSSAGSSFLAKVKGQQLPGDFVAYLRKVRRPELVEVGKLHKLRLLLRNETVAWTEEFIGLGGMREMVELLERIMAVEWREEHEDALLHENLLCLKALCTTDMALQYLDSIHGTLFPALLHMIFDPEKKGPSEFTTRGIITSMLLTYIEAAAAPADRAARARAVLGFLRDPEPKEDERPLDFVLEMRRDRPYRVWCKEVVNVTKEVFWIFLHNLNIVALPAADNGGKPHPPPLFHTQQHHPLTTTTTTHTASSASPSSYMTRHFPQPRPPVPAAPYVGGVEWDATNYLASHLDLLNAILACTEGAEARNALRSELRVSGWERCLGGSLRLCKEKFYGAVHDGLRTWVAAASEDGWDVRDVRFGPPPPQSATPRKVVEKREAPRIEMPRLDFGIGGGVVRAGEPWLS